MRNSMVAFLCKILVLLFAYASRVVFIRVLDIESTGASGLFNSVLIVFSLNSLGIDTALAFMLYAPIVEKDIKRQQSLIQAFRRVHLMIGAIVVLAFIILYFALPYMSKEAAAIPDIGLIYWLFAGNVILGYVQTHKQIMFLADQQNYINDLYESGQLILQYYGIIVFRSYSVILVDIRHFIAVSVFFPIGSIECRAQHAEQDQDHDRRYHFLHTRLSPFIAGA